MIGSRRAAQRFDPVAFAEGLTDWHRGVDSHDSEAAVRNLAEILIRMRGPDG